ncbi:TatD family hydrolase [uncultured Gulosibacter sp.]|uniref:TatD family hydrolase n=1 Tax=uncultured Gulosibacter sp. TaxID=1339167 RepID=UPI00288BE3AB|nr:TatD family hydrolase [uncultured Gulosibacter sp.]
MTALLDTHYHYDFLPPRARGPFLQQLADEGITVVAQTVTPSGFVRLEADEHQRKGMHASSQSRPVPAPLLSLGFHPWYLGDDTEHELELFADALVRTRFIGEIGLDFAPRRLAAVPAATQLTVLRRMLRAVQQASADRQFILSIHAVRAVTEVLDLLAECRVDTAAIVPVFHRFGGTSDQLTRLVRAGGYISVGTQMLDTKRGRAYATQVPNDRLLLETDLPTASDTASEHDPAHEVTASLRATVNELARLRGLDAAQLTARISQTSSRLYGAVS